MGVILREGLVGHSWCHIQKKDWRGIVGVILKKDWQCIVGVILNEGLAGDSRCHIKGRTGGA